MQPGRGVNTVRGAVGRKRLVFFGMWTKTQVGCFYVGGSFGLLLGPFPPGGGWFAWVRWGREWALALDDVCSGVNVCVCVSLPALVQLAVPCEGGWLVLVPSTLDPSFYTLAKAKRRGSQHNRKPLVITVGPCQSLRVIAQPRNAAGPSGLPVSILLSKETTDRGVFVMCWGARAVSYSCMQRRGMQRSRGHKEVIPALYHLHRHTEIQHVLRKNKDSLF